MTITLTLDRTGDRRDLDQGILRIGRSPDNDWVIADDGGRTVSRRHCEIHRQEGRAWITDLGSANGTLLNGRPLAPQVAAPLEPGDVLTLGLVTIRVMASAAGAAVSPPPAPPHTAGRRMISILEGMQAPPAPSPGPPSPAPAGDALAAFLAGAGLPPPQGATGDDPAAILRRAGAVFAAMAEGYRILLATGQPPGPGDPLGAAASAAEAAATLLGRSRSGRSTADPVQAIRDSVDILQGRAAGGTPGLETAIDRLLASLDPARLEQGLRNADTLSALMKGGRRAQLWDLYKERYAGIAAEARHHLLTAAEPQAHPAREAAALPDAALPDAALPDAALPDAALPDANGQEPAAALTPAGGRRRRRR